MVARWEDPGLVFKLSSTDDILSVLSSFAGGDEQSWLWGSCMQWIQFLHLASAPEAEHGGIKRLAGAEAWRGLFIFYLLLRPNRDGEGLYAFFFFFFWRPKSQVKEYFYEAHVHKDGPGPNKAADRERAQALPVKWDRESSTRLDEGSGEDHWSRGQVQGFRLSDNSTFRDGEIQRDAKGKLCFYVFVDTLRISEHFSNMILWLCIWSFTFLSICVIVQNTWYPFSIYDDRNVNL